MKDTTTTERVGRYQLLEPIGSGPTGAVWRAKVFGVAGFERQFAIKRFHAELTASAANAAALSAGARAYGSLEHPRIARMTEFGVAQGTTFTAVELVVGLDAMRLISEARLSGITLAAGGALALVSQAARAVGYAHGRGLTHLGLAPTNVIVTPDGDVKITDFGILSANLPPRPIDVARLANRIGHLAPEQLAAEATSAATDVFALGVLAYELVTGQRTFRGETPQQVAHTIMAGPPPEPPLPRPIVRVLQRCLARSPFERFPDARAFADALDAALRVAPVPGTRKDVGLQVKHTLDRMRALHESEMSGVLSLGGGTAAPRTLTPSQLGGVPPAGRRSAGRDSNETLDQSTTEFVRPDVPVAGPSPLVGPRTGEHPAVTMPDLPMPTLTMTGLPPPPSSARSAVPAGLGPPGPPPPSELASPPTLLGMPNKRPPAIPAVRPQTPTAARGARTSSPPAIPPVPKLPGGPPPARLETDLAVPIEPVEPNYPDLDPMMVIEIDRDEPRSDATQRDDLTAPPVAQTEPGVTEAAPAPRAKRPSFETDSMSPLLVDKLNQAATKPTEEVPPLVAEAWRAQAIDEFPDEAHVTRRAPSAPIAAPPPPTAAPEVLASPRKPSRAPWLVVGVLGAGALGVFGWQVYASMNKPSPDAPTSAKVATHDVASAKPDAAGHLPPVVDATVAMATAVDAKPAAPPADAPVLDAAPVAAAHADAAVAVAAAPPSGTSTDLSITSTPGGARVFLDGTDAGVTPLKLPGSHDRHTIALLLAAHELYIAQVDGHGSFTIPLKEVTPSSGPAGIKVLKCAKGRYYVFLDGKPTGQTCPTERLGCEVGAHTVETYDLVSEARKKWDVVVKDTRLSVRVRVE